MSRLVGGLPSVSVTLEAGRATAQPTSGSVSPTEPLRNVSASAGPTGVVPSSPAEVGRSSSVTPAAGQSIALTSQSVALTSQSDLVSSPSTAMPSYSASAAGPDLLKPASMAVATSLSGHSVAGGVLSTAPVGSPTSPIPGKSSSPLPLPAGAPPGGSASSSGNASGSSSGGFGFVMGSTRDLLGLSPWRQVRATSANWNPIFVLLIIERPG